MDSRDNIFDDASAIYKGELPVVHIQRGNDVLFDQWPNCTISANIDEHAHGVEPATVPYGQPYQSDEITVDAGYCISNVEIIMG